MARCLRRLLGLHALSRIRANPPLKRRQSRSPRHFHGA
jgi:hypothetical protein